MTWALGIAVWAALAAGDGAVNAYVTLDPPEIPFHRQALYTVTVEAPSGVDVKLPDMVDKLGGLGVADLRRDTKPLSGGRQRISETYVLDPIFAADYKIYPAKIQWGENQSLEVPSPALRVRDLTDDEKKQAEQFADIDGPIPVQNVVIRYWKYWVPPVAALLVVAVLALVLYKRRQLKALAAPPPPPWEVAYARLRELDQRQLPKAGRYEPFYVDLSSILRYYIEDRFLVRAPELTTQEFLAAASSHREFSDGHKKLLFDFLRHCDYVKFAQYVPTVPEMEQRFLFVLQFVDETKPEEQHEAEQEAAA